MATDVVVDAWAGAARMLADRAGLLAAELDRANEAVRRLEAELEDARRRLAVHENYNNPPARPPSTPSGAKSTGARPRP